MPSSPATVQQEEPPKSLSREFIAGKPLSLFAFSIAAQQLSLPTPDTLSKEQIDLMRYDPVVDSAIELLVEQVLAEGHQIVSATVQDFETESAEIAKFISRNVEKVINFREKCEQLLEAIAYAHVIAENVFDFEPTGQDKGKLMLQAMKIKDYGAAQFVVDKFWNVLGLKAAGQPDSPLLPREKFVVFSLRKRGEDPRGRTSLRSSFEPWRAKREIWPAWIRFLKTCAIPSLVGKLPPNARPQPVLDGSGNPVPDGNGGHKTQSPVLALKESLEGLANSMVGVVGAETEITPLETTGEGEVFRNAMDAANGEIRTGILRQTRATGEAEHGSKADSETGRSMLSFLIATLRERLALAFKNDLFKPLVLWNYGPEALRFVPDISFGETDRYDWSIDANAANQFKANVAPSQWAAMCIMLGLPEPTVEEAETMRKTWEAEQKQRQEPPKPPEQPTISKKPKGDN